MFSIVRTFEENVSEKEPYFRKALLLLDGICSIICVVDDGLFGALIEDIDMYSEADDGDALYTSSL